MPEKTFFVELPDGGCIAQKGRGRQSVCMSITGYRISKAIALGLIVDVHSVRPKESGDVVAENLSISNRRELRRLIKDRLT